MDDIEQKVKKIIAEQLGIKEEDIKNESSFIEDLGADARRCFRHRNPRHRTGKSPYGSAGHRLRQGRRREVIRTFGQRLEASCR